MDIVFIGAGRLATSLATALNEKGHRIKAVYSRTMVSASTLASRVEADAFDDLTYLPQKADAFIVAVKDSAIGMIADQLKVGREDQCIFHTSGSVSMSVFGGEGNYGVLYPLQTFSMNSRVDLSRVPFYIEGNTDTALNTVRTLAEMLSDRVVTCSSDERRRLHLAAVFACNFVNHCYNLAAQLLEEQSMDFADLLPLIDETADKVHRLHPRDAQTGPAVRYDQGIIDTHIDLLSDHPDAQAIYLLMSESIRQHHNYHI